MLKKPLKKHIWIHSIVFLGLIFWVFFAGPHFGRIPASFSFSEDVVSQDNFYSVEEGRYTGAQQSRAHILYDIASYSNTKAVIQNIFEVADENGKVFFSVERNYGFNPKTKKHIPGFGDKDREGYLFAPRMKGFTKQVPDKAAFDYWHINYDVPIHMEYREEDNLEGLDLYRYVSNFSVDQTEELTGKIPGVGESLGIITDVNLQMWIEPATGFLITYEDTAEAYYYNLATGDRLYPWNKFNNHLSDNTVKNQVELATIVKQRFTFFGLILPGIILVLLLLSILIRQVLNRRLQDEIASGSVKKKKSSYVNSIVLFVFLSTLTLIAFRFVSSSFAKNQELEFEREVDHMHQAIENRLGVYINTLNGARGLLEASDFVDRSEWKSYVDGLNISDELPGVQGIGYSVFVKPEDLQDHIDTIRAEGFPDFTVSPAGERDLYSSIVYLEPFDKRNREAFGFDMFQNPVRRKAMVYARDTGKVGLSGKVTLVQEIDEDVQAGFLAYVPYYGKDRAYDSIYERRDHIVGYVYAAFRMNNFMNSIGIVRDSDLDIEVYDGPSLRFSEEDRMYQTEIRTDIFEIVNTTNRRIELGGHVWTIKYNARSSYGSNFFETSTASLVLVTGLVISFLLALMVYILSTRREKALSLANTMTNDLRQRTEENERIAGELEKANADLEEKSKTLESKMNEIEDINKHLIGRELKMVELKDKLKDQKDI